MKINNNFNIDSLIDNRDVAIVRGRKNRYFFLKYFKWLPIFGLPQKDIMENH